MCLAPLSRNLMCFSRTGQMKKVEFSVMARGKSQAGALRIPIPPNGRRKYWQLFHNLPRRRNTRLFLQTRQGRDCKLNKESQTAAIDSEGISAFVNIAF
jgi:hypothetical protein